MAAPPLTFLEKQRIAQINSGSGHFIESARQNSQRRRINPLNRDTHRNLSPQDRETILTLGRWAYNNVDIIKGTFGQSANIASKGLTQQFAGSRENKEWGDEAEQVAWDHDHIADFRGAPYSTWTTDQQIILAHYRDGDMLTVFVESENGWPMHQNIPAHRIVSATFDEEVRGGPWDGARIIDGVIVDRRMRVMAYRVWTGSDWLKKGQSTGGKLVSDSNGNPLVWNATTGDGDPLYSDISARTAHLSFIPDWPDQLRGIGQMGAVSQDMQDYREARALDQAQRKLNASVGFIEFNESGESTDPELAMNGQGSATTSGEERGPTEEVGGVTVRYFKANSNSAIEPLKNDNPSQNVQSFEDRFIRSALHALNWPIDFAFNPTKIGGAAARMMIQQVNMERERLQQYLLFPWRRRWNAFRIAKLIKLGRLPMNEEWNRWEITGGERLTADAKYDVDVDNARISNGTTTRRKVIAKGGDYWLDVHAQKADEAKDLIDRAEQLSKETGKPFELCLLLLASPTPNGVPSQNANPQPDNRRPVKEEPNEDEEDDEEESEDEEE